MKGKGYIRHTATATDINKVARAWLPAYRAYLAGIVLHGCDEGKTGG